MKLLDYVNRPSVGWQITYCANILAVLKLLDELEKTDWYFIAFFYGAGFILTLVEAGVRKLKDDLKPKQ